MPSMTLNIDAATEKVLHDLQEKTGAASKTEVIRRGIALLRLAADRQTAEGVVKIIGVDPLTRMPVETSVLLR